MSYFLKKKVNINFDEIRDKLSQELSKEGFGILNEIDIKETMKKKLDLDYDNYIIFGACNPKLADRALNCQKEIGLLLPCNIVFYEEKGDNYISFVSPDFFMNSLNNECIAEIGKEAGEKLKRVFDNLN